MFEDDIDKRKWMRTQKSYGPDWDAAIEYGIDVSLIEQTLEMSFDERLRSLESMLRLIHGLSSKRDNRGTPSTP